MPLRGIRAVKGEDGYRGRSSIGIIRADRLRILYKTRIHISPSAGRNKDHDAIHPIRVYICIKYSRKLRFTAES